MSLSHEKIAKLLNDYRFDEVIEKLSDIVKSGKADYFEYASFINAVASFYDKDNYITAFECFIKANQLKDIDTVLQKSMYEQISEIIKSLGFSYFNDENTFEIDRQIYLQARFMLFISASKNKDALDAISQMIEEFPTPANYFQRSKIYLLMKKYKNALSDMNTALEMAQTPDFYLNRALLKQKINDMGGALADFNSAIALSPENPLYYFCRGILQENLGNFKIALDDFKKTLQLDSGNYEALTELSWCYYKLGMLNEAFSFASMAINFNPNIGNAYYVRGTIANVLHIFEGAISDLTVAMNIDNRSDKLWSSKIFYQKAYAEYRLKNFEQAQKDIREAIKLSKRSIPYYLLAMDIEFFGLENYFSAKEYCLEILKIDEENPSALAAQQMISAKIQDM